jgi:peptidyl-prolyl cis-trans isomerase A (cyclophilin A)
MSLARPSLLLRHVSLWTSVIASLVACRNTSRPVAPPPAHAIATAVPPVAFEEVWGVPPPAAEPLALLVAQVLQAAASSDTARLETLVSQPALARMAIGRAPGAPLPVMPGMVARRLGGGPVRRVVHEGGRAVVLVDHGKRHDASYFYLEQGRWTYDPIDMSPFQPPLAGAQDVDNRELSLAEVSAELPGTGSTLTAELDTSEGVLNCVLAAELAPRTVANFIGLARGLRAVGIGPDAKPLAKFGKRRFYDGLAFHRSVVGLLAETGDPSGRGGHAGYTIADEFHLKLRHDRPGVLAMASRGPNTGSAAFYVTARAAPWLDDRHAVFGLCTGPEVLERLTRAPQGQMTLRSVRIARAPP